MDEFENPEVVALRSLCDRHGGFRVVASKLGVNDQSLYQILAKVKLKSGRPKGIGPSLREKLNEHYPGWSVTQSAHPMLANNPDRLQAILGSIAGQFRMIPESEWGDALMDVAATLQKRGHFR